MIQSFFVPVGSNVAKPLGTCPSNVGIDLRQRLVRNTLQRFAEPDQQTFDRKLALAVG